MVYFFELVLTNSTSYVSEYTHFRGPLVTDKALGRSRHLIHLKEIPHSAHCADQFILKTAVQFVTEILDVNVDNIRIGFCRHVPYTLRKCGAGMGLSRIFDQKLQQREFTRRQVDVAAVSFDPALAAVKYQLAGLRLLLDLVRSATPQSAYPGHQLQQRKRFHQAVVDPMLKRGNQV